MDDKEHQAYFGVRLEEGSEISHEFSYGPDLDSMKEWAAKVTPGDVDQENVPKDDEPESPIEEKGSLTDIMDRIIDTGMALQELTLSSQAVQGIFSATMARFEIIGPIKDECPIVESFDNAAIYGISMDRFLKVRDRHRRLERMDRGFALLPSAILLTIVATFDSLTSDVIRHMLSLRPDRFDSMEKTMQISDILKMSSFEDLKSRLIEDEIYQFSRGGHDEQVKQIEKWFGVKIIEHWKRWPDFIEVFERINLIAHGETKFTKRYSDICTRHGHKGSDKILGSDIELKLNYLAQALDILLEFSILLLFSIWRKQIPAEESEAYDCVNNACYKLISDERYRVPVRVLEYVLGLKGAKVSEVTRLMMIVNLASAHRHMKQEDKCKEVLDSVDWSAVSDNYKICVSALRGEIGEVCRLMAIVAKADTVKKVDFRGWPVFDYVREESEFKEAFERVFFEPFDDPMAQSKKLPTEEAAVIDIEAAEKTLH